jgi:2-polyprenyl-6-methoxyphenol hydroxylase-like FAD-dependent oxidoreductase
MGASLALIGAYVPAGELADATDHEAAYAAYEKTMRPIVDEAQKLPPGVPRIANPTSVLGVRILRAVVRLAGTAPVRALAGRLMSSPDDAKALPDYGH